METVLIVDDEEWVRYLIANLIKWEEIGAKVAGFAGDGAEALREAARIHPDLVITDIRMPDVDGVQLFTQLRASQRDVQVIVVSGYDDFSYAQQAVKAGVHDYILKPVGKQELLAAVRGALELIRTERARQRRLRAAAKTVRKLQHTVGEGPADGAAGISGDDPVDRAADIVNRRYDEPLTLQQIADEVYLNPNYLSTEFKRKKGVGLHDHLIRVRMEEAKRLLSHREFRVSEVARLTGYQDTNYFSRAFRRYTGQTPTEYAATEEVDRENSNRDAVPPHNPDFKAEQHNS